MAGAREVAFDTQFDDAEAAQDRFCDRIAGG